MQSAVDQAPSILIRLFCYIHKHINKYVLFLYFLSPFAVYWLLVVLSSQAFRWQSMWYIRLNKLRSTACSCAAYPHFPFIRESHFSVNIFALSLVCCIDKRKLNCISHLRKKNPEYKMHEWLRNSSFVPSLWDKKTHSESKVHACGRW